MKKDPLRDKKYQLLQILKDHDVTDFATFIEENPDQFLNLTTEQKSNFKYLYDVLHLYKANLIYMGPQYFESVNYCVNNGIIELSEEGERLFREAERNQEEIQSCVISPESGQEPHR